MSDEIKTLGVNAPRFSIINGDCLDALKSLPDNSADSLVTDPPAGIAFMGKQWDSDKGGREAWVDWLSNVMREALRVLKPGAHGLVWALPRTSHWTATALELAGFDVRDVVTHLFGSGFPKSLDVSKAIDKAAGAEREVISTRKLTGKARVLKGGNFDGDYEGKDLNENYVVTAPATPAAKQWQGWGTALKPASEHWILVRKPLGEKTVAANVLEHGVGGVNIDACRIALSGNENMSAVQNGRIYGDGDIYGVGVQKQTTPTYKHNGRFPANLVLSHSDDCKLIGEKKGNGTKTVDAWECVSECAVKALDEQSGVLKSGGGNKRSKKPQFGGRKPTDFECASSTGGASRFFYCAKASKSDRGKDNKHPTVKSSKLMTYLITLVTPPNGTVLDPFMGSGSTGVAAIKGGWQFIGIEQELEYCEISRKRIMEHE